jgi:hypothetical protein
MEKTLIDIEADVARLRADAAKYRQLAEERKAADHVMISQKLLELVADIEKEVARLEAVGKVRRMAS